MDWPESEPVFFPNILQGQYCWVLSMLLYHFRGIFGKRRAKNLFPSLGVDI
jgi:hypothetical protein